MPRSDRSLAQRKTRDANGHVVSKNSFMAHRRFCFSFCVRGKPLGTRCLCETPKSQWRGELRFAGAIATVLEMCGKRQM